MSSLVAAPLLPATPAHIEAVEPAAVNKNVLPSGCAAALIQPDVSAPFPAIRKLFDHLRSNPVDASALNAAYLKRGVYKTAAIDNAASDQKFTIDLSPARAKLIPASLRTLLETNGLGEILYFFHSVQEKYIDNILPSISTITCKNLTFDHAKSNLNFRLCDYNTDTADPSSDNGCGTHADYGTFSIIFQDGTPGLEFEDTNNAGTWIPVPGDATVVLAGWCAVVLSGGHVTAARHRVRRIPGVRRLSAVLFAAPDMGAKLQPLEGVEPVRRFAEPILRGEVSVGWFKEVMGKRWRWREGNEKLEHGEEVTQDAEIEKLIFG